MWLQREEGTNTRSWYKSTPSCSWNYSQAGQCSPSAGSVLSKLVFPVSINWRMWFKEASASVSRARSDHGIVLSSWASFRMEANIADSRASGKSGEFECEGYLEAASAA